MNPLETSFEQRTGSGGFLSKCGSRDGQKNISISAVISTSCVVLEGLRDSTDCSYGQSVGPIGSTGFGQSFQLSATPSYFHNRNPNDFAGPSESTHGVTSDGVSPIADSGDNFFQSEASEFTTEGSGVAVDSRWQFRDNQTDQPKIASNPCNTLNIKQYRLDQVGAINVDKESFTKENIYDSKLGHSAELRGFEPSFAMNESELFQGNIAGPTQEPFRYRNCGNSQDYVHSTNMLQNELVPLNQCPDSILYRNNDVVEPNFAASDHQILQNSAAPWAPNFRSHYQPLPTFLDTGDCTAVSSVQNRSIQQDDLTSTSHMNNFSSHMSVSLYGSPEKTSQSNNCSRPNLYDNNFESCKDALVSYPDCHGSVTSLDGNESCLGDQKQQFGMEYQHSEPQTGESFEIKKKSPKYFRNVAQRRHCQPKGLQSASDFDTSDHLLCQTSISNNNTTKVEDISVSTNIQSDTVAWSEMDTKPTETSEASCSLVSSTKTRKKHVETVESLQHQLEMLEDRRKNMTPSCASLNFLRQRTATTSEDKTEEADGAQNIVDVDHMICSGVTVAGFKPRAIIRKRSKTSTPNDIKNGDYWQKRRKNNDSARKSRESKKEKEKNFYKRALELEYENFYLQECLSLAEAELAALGHPFVPPGFPGQCYY